MAERGAQVADTPAVVLAGGRGTRIAAVTRDAMPKALLPIGGRPFLEHQLEWLARQGVATVVLAVGFLGEQLRQHFGTRWGGLELLWSDEGERLLGTGGGTARALALVPGASRVFVVNGDTWFPVSLPRLLALHQERGAAATIALARQPERGRFGAVELAADERVRGFAEKSEEGEGWINGGVYCLERTLLEEAAARAEGAAFSLERDLLAARVDELPVYGMPAAEGFCDIGVPDAYRAFATTTAATGPRR